MTNDYLDLILDIFDETDQRASVRASLTAGQLIEEIIREFDGLDAQQRDSYALTVAGRERPLAVGQSLGAQGVQPGDRLAFSWMRSGPSANRRPLSVSGAALEALGQGAVYPLRWQPALIGRPDTGAAHNELLAANVEWLAGSRRVSRRHAQVTERGGVFYIQALAAEHQTYLNNRELDPETPAPLQDGDRIELGRSRIVLRFGRQLPGSHHPGS